MSGTAPRPKEIRFRVQPGDAPAYIAARRLGLTVADFLEKLPALLARNFPAADPTTGNYDLDAIDAWRKSRHAALYGLTTGATQGESSGASSMGERFVAAKERTRNGRAA